jgi:hypothetical protein
MNEIPALGQQTDVILSELGFDSTTVAELAARRNDLISPRQYKDEADGDQRRLDRKSF